MYNYVLRNKLNNTRQLKGNHRDLIPVRYHDVLPNGSDLGNELSFPQLLFIYLTLSPVENFRFF
jgi:hypothetical protein